MKEELEGSDTVDGAMQPVNVLEEEKENPLPSLFFLKSLNSSRGQGGNP